MKKLIIIPLLLLTILFTIGIFTDASGSAKLPEGKNYINSSNIYEKDGYIYTKKPFMVKSDTMYTFSISRDYVDGGPFELIYNYYDENGTFLNKNSRDENTLFFDKDTNTYFFRLKTTTSTGKIDFYFTDNGTYEDGKELVNVQLEEGNQFTEYEPNLEQSFFESDAFYFIFLGVLVFGIGFGIVVNILNKKKNFK